MSDSFSIGTLTGLLRLPPEHEQYIFGAQLRAADNMLALRATLSMVSIIFVDLALLAHASGWLLLCWSFLAFFSLLPSVRFARYLEYNDYIGVTRYHILGHALICALQGAIWVMPMAFLAGTPDPAEFVIFWTTISCLMTAVAIGYHPTPLASGTFLVTVGSGAIWLMWRLGEPLLVAVVTTFTLLLLVATLRQAHQFGLQFTTDKQLAEKQEVVSMLLKEHDMRAADWLWQTDASRRLTGVTPAFARMLGAEPEAIEGRSIFEVLAGPSWASGQFDPALHLLAEKLKMRIPFSDLVLPVQIGEEQHWWEISASPRVDQKGAFIGFRGVGSDITAEKQSRERMDQMARFDMLTNLPNRVHLSEVLGETLDLTAQRDTRCAFLMIDLDRFKGVNDTLGHLIGDQLLAQVAQRLRQVCTPNELCGRLGGDEFAVIIRDLPDSLYLEQISHRLIDVISAPYEVDGHTLFVGASIGSALAPRDARTAEALIRSADLAMYRSKLDGGGKHTAYEPSMHADAEERRKIEIALRDALAKDELHLVYQPIVCAQTSAVLGFEALARWTHPEMGAIAPSRFIPVAEDARLIGSIGNWVLRNACQEAMHWPESLRISVNVSAEQLYDPEFLEMVISALAHSGLPATRLELEVTESVFMREGTGLNVLLDKLTQLGVRLSLDDFGTGYSSLGYLSRTRFSTIKIDRSFVNGAARGKRECLAIVRAVVALAESLEMQTTAEGVETEQELEVVRELGCTKIQGYYFGRPMAAADARNLFDDYDSAVA